MVDIYPLSLLISLPFMVRVLAGLGEDGQLGMEGISTDALTGTQAAVKLEASRPATPLKGTTAADFAASIPDPTFVFSLVPASLTSTPARSIEFIVYLCSI
jgi:hypothetical protein